VRVSGGQSNVDFSLRLFNLTTRSERHRALTWFGVLGNFAAIYKAERELRCSVLSPSSILETSVRYSEARVRNSSEVSRIEADARFSSR
jgi:hypothetical protein